MDDPVTAAFREYMAAKRECDAALARLGLALDAYDAACVAARRKEQEIRAGNPCGWCGVTGPHRHKSGCYETLLAALRAEVAAARPGWAGVRFTPGARQGEYLSGSHFIGQPIPGADRCAERGEVEPGP